MSRNNDVFSVLVATGDQAIATTGGPGALLAGQIGVYDAETNVAITAGDTPKNFYIAVGTANGPVFSAGQKIQSTGFVSAVNKEYEAGVNPIYEINDYADAAAAETEFSIRVELYNDQIAKALGNVQFTVPLAIKTGCDPIGADPNEITRLFLDAISANGGEFITAVPITNDNLTIVTHGVAADYSAGDEILYADLAIIRDYNIANATSLSTGFQITTVPADVIPFNDVNVNYIYPRETKATIGLGVGFECYGTVTEDTALVYEQGLGYDVKQREFQAQGWADGQGAIERQSSLFGLAFPKTFNAVEAANYNSLSLEYNYKSGSAWLEYEDNLTTEIAIQNPLSDLGGGATTYSQLIAVLNPIIALSGLSALS